MGLFKTISVCDDFSYGLILFPPFKTAFNFIESYLADVMAQEPSQLLPQADTRNTVRNSGTDSHNRTAHTWLYLRRQRRKKNKYSWYLRQITPLSRQQRKRTTDENLLAIPLVSIDTSSSPSFQNSLPWTQGMKFMVSRLTIINTTFFPKL